jgi:hypothetical protein
MIRTPSRKMRNRYSAAKPATIRKAAAPPQDELQSLAGVNWSLPSGECLTEFALRFGFLAPTLLGSSEEGFPRQRNRRGR